MELTPDAYSALHPSIRVQPTGDARGRGLFTTAPVTAGTVLWREVETTALRQRVRLADLDRLTPERRALILHYAWQVDEETIEGPATGDDCLRDASFVWNHSCDPTAWLVSDEVIVARRDLAVGEEITCDYATWTTSPAVLATQIPGQCLCGSALCRGTITAEDWRRPDLRDRYGEHFVSFIRRQIVAEEEVRSGRDRASGEFGL